MPTRGDKQLRAKDDKPASFLDATDQIHVFEQRPVGTSPDLLESAPANENSLISCCGFGEAASKIDPRCHELQRTLTACVKADLETSARYFRRPERGGDAFSRIQ